MIRSFYFAKHLSFCQLQKYNDECCAVDTRLVIEVLKKREINFFCKNNFVIFFEFFSES